MIPGFIVTDFCAVGTNVDIDGDTVDKAIFDILKVSADSLRSFASFFITS
jgi:hypothetical protein